MEQSDCLEVPAVACRPRRPEVTRRRLRDRCSEHRDRQPCRAGGRRWDRCILWVHRRGPAPATGWYRSPRRRCTVAAFRFGLVRRCCERHCTQFCPRRGTCRSGDATGRTNRWRCRCLPVGRPTPPRRRRFNTFAVEGVGRGRNSLTDPEVVPLPARNSVNEADRMGGHARMAQFG